MARRVTAQPGRAVVGRGTQNSRIWIDLVMIGTESPSAQNGGSACGYQRDFRDVGDPASVEIIDADPRRLG